MSDKTDLIYDLLSKMETRQHEKAIADASRHANEDLWREGTTSTLGQHSTVLKKHDERLEIVEKPKQVLEFLQSKAGKVTTRTSALLSLVWMIYRMIS